jgi:hypothetical protein
MIDDGDDWHLLPPKEMNSGGNLFEILDSSKGVLADVVTREVVPEVATRNDICDGGLQDLVVTMAFVTTSAQQKQPW